MPFDVTGGHTLFGGIFSLKVAEGCNRAEKKSKLLIDARMLAVPGKETMLSP